MPSSVPVIDLTPWLSGDAEARAAVAAQVDGALRCVGFFLVTGHGVADDMRARVRAEARAFFALPREVKQRYAVTVAGRGWLPPGVEANAYAEGTETPPDLKESFAVGADQPTGDPDVDGYWFQPNVYPEEVPDLQAAVVAYLARMRELADELLVLCAAALGLERDFFTRHTGHATHTMNINWYPPMAIAGQPEAGQFRIGPHTDFGTVTILDREPGRGGLQVWTAMAGRTLLTCRALSRSTPATCWPAGAVTGGSPTGTAFFRRRLRRPMRTSSRSCTSTRPTTMRWSRRCGRRSASPTTTRRSYRQRS